MVAMSESNAPGETLDALTLRLLENEATSYWLRDALRTALQRDCVDAVADAEILLDVLRSRANQALETPA